MVVESLTVPAPHAPRATQAPQPATVACAWGDGIGPEIMDATLAVLSAAGARMSVVPVEMGERLYRQGISTGIAPDAWTAVRAHGVLLKAPMTTPRGKGVKSLNVTLRKALGLYANVRPVRSLSPYVVCRHPELDLIIVRENEEDLYAGIEHRQTREVVQCLKLISRPGCERLIRHAFELARQQRRHRVTCMVKDNIMKLTDGLFAQVFREVAEEYPDLQSDTMIIDIGAARLADHPEHFDVVVCPNLYGDILSDIAAQLGGSVGLAGSSNIGLQAAMFEAVHGSAPDIAGQDVANPSGLLQAAVQMLVHLDQWQTANRIEDAWLRTLEDGVHTADLYRAGFSRVRVGTQRFAQEVVARLGEAPRTLPPARYARVERLARPPATPTPREHKELVGVDVFVDWDDGRRQPEALADRLRPCQQGGLDLVMITNRGVKVWPDGLPETWRTDHWRCRFQPAGGRRVDPVELVHLLGRLVADGIDVIKTEHLYTFDGEPGFSMGQGQ